MRALIIIFLVALPGLALAAPQLDEANREQALEQLEARFKQADVDQDGKLTYAEAQQGMPRVAKNFSKIDVARNGYVTVEQIGAFIQQASGG